MLNKNNISYTIITDSRFKTLMNDDLTNELDEIIKELLEKDDIRLNNYEFYTIEVEGGGKNIYNEESIKLLENILAKIDDF